MSPRHFERMFGKLIQESLDTEDWRRGRRAFKAKACGFDCEARLRLNVLARGDEGSNVTAEFELFLMRVGGEPEASVFATLRCHVTRKFFPSLVPLYQALFASAESQLKDNAAFQALSERRELGAVVRKARLAAKARRSSRL